MTRIERAVFLKLYSDQVKAENDAIEQYKHR